MSKEFDIKQKAVLDSNVHNQLVSAGAGSGKTTVMVKKIADTLISGKASPNEIVVLTFTNLAAAEMKQRLIKVINEELAQQTSLEEIERISNILNELEMSYVDTIDGFCSKMNKKYFYKLQSSPDVSIATGLSLDYYINKSLDRCISLALENNKEAVIELADCFEKNSRSLDVLKENLHNAFTFIMAQKDYQTFLQSSLHEYQGLYKSSNYLNEILVSTIEKETSNINYYLHDLKNYTNYYNSVSAYVECISKISIKNSVLENVKFFKFLPHIALNRIKDEDKFSYNKVKNSIDAIKSLVDDFTFLQNFNDNYFQNHINHFNTFINLLHNFIECYQNMKFQYKVVDFLDLERQFLKLLTFDDIKTELHNQFKYIFVDEYQDINPMQNEIIHLLKSNNANMFFVGDVKQSIYGFRQSTPELFLELYNKYKNEKDSQSFDMNINFRSNPQILEFNNEIFCSLMTKDKTDIDYKMDAKFEPKRTDFGNNKDSVEIALFDSNNKQDEIISGLYSVKNDTSTKKKTAIESEALFIADKINDIVGKPFYDSSLKAIRKMEYKDIAILSRGINDSKTEYLVQTLREQNIPIAINNKISLIDCESVNLVYNILRVLTNNVDDVALATYLTSSFGEISLDELFSIVNYSKEKNLIEQIIDYKTTQTDELSAKIKYALDILEELKINSSTLSNLEIIDLLLNHYHLKQYILNTENGSTELTALNNFLATITSRENELSLEDFISYIKLNLDSNTDYGENDAINAVTIQTIHASKGLEYPVVILFNSSRAFKPNNDRDDINFDTELGIGMQYFDLVNRTKIDSIPKLAIKIKNKIKCYKEELRLLYVATTRPQNRLIITGSVKFENLNNGKLSNNNFIELIYSVYQNSVNLDDEKTELKNCIIYHYSDYTPTIAHSSDDKYISININSKNIDFMYPFMENTNIVLKNNVTSISREQNEDYNILPEKLNLKEHLNATIDSSAELGTIYHQVLSEIDFCQEYQASSNPIVDISLIKTAYDKISLLAKGCKNINKEAQFLMYVPYCEVNQDSAIKDRVLIQGVVDLMIEFEDHFVLIDYKYSKLGITQLKEKYKKQLQLYKIAIEKAYKKPVTNSYIYKINSGEMI